MQRNAPTGGAVGTKSVVVSTGSVARAAAGWEVWSLTRTR